MINACKSEAEFKKLLTQWGVMCASTGQFLPIYREEMINGHTFFISNLTYWNVERQEFYATPYVVPENQTKVLEKHDHVDTSEANTEGSAQ